MKAQGASKFVVKAQVLGGGRGLGSFKHSGLKGGVHVVDSVDQVSTLSE